MGKSEAPAKSPTKGSTKKGSSRRKVQTDKPVDLKKVSAKDIPTDEPLTNEELGAIKDRTNLGGRDWDGPPYRQLDQCRICKEEIVWYWYDMPALRRGKPPTKIAYKRKHICYKCIATNWNTRMSYQKSSLSNWWSNRRRSLNGKGPKDAPQ